MAVGIPSYRAAQAPDGTWTIFDVPVFAAHSEERADRTLEFGGKWLSAALEQARVRESEGYVPPLHTKHHGEGCEVDAAGKFALRRVGPIQHGGETVQALFADLIGVRPEVYERIRRGELSYRSVEILDVSKPEIDSLALLDDEVPFFRFPLLRVAEDTNPLPQGAPAPLPVVRAAGPGAAVLAYAAYGHSSSALFKFKEHEMSEPKAKTGAAPSTDPTMKMGDPAAIVKQLMSLMQQLGQALGGQKGPGPVEQPAPAPQPPMAQAQQHMPPQRPQAPFAVGTFSAEQAALEGENAGLRAKFEALEAKFSALEAARKMDAKSSDLKAKGFSTDTVTSFEAKAREQGLEAALHYAAGLESAGAPSDPPTHWTGEVRSEAPDAPEVAKFAAQGPEILNEAREMFASWKRSASEVPFADFFAANRDADHYMAHGA